MILKLIGFFFGQVTILIQSVPSCNDLTLSFGIMEVDMDETADVGYTLAEIKDVSTKPSGYIGKKT